MGSTLEAMPVKEDKGAKRATAPKRKPRGAKAPAGDLGSQAATLAKPEERKAANAKKPTGVRNKDLGRRGEDAAARFLDKRGYDIIERNWECAFGEADIIAKDGEYIVFIEVKTRKDCQKGFPSEAVSREKRAKYEKIALCYLQNYDAADVPVRFDVISIVAIAPNRALIRHQINAFSVV